MQALHPGFELRLPGPFPMIITITPQTPHDDLLIIMLMKYYGNKAHASKQKCNQI